MIEKLECIGYVKKWMDFRLRKLRKNYKGKHLEGGKPLSGQGRLREKKIYQGSRCTRIDQDIHLVFESLELSIPSHRGWIKPNPGVFYWAFWNLFGF